MIGFVGIPPFLRLALQVAITTMHFHIAQIGLFLEPLFFIFRESQGTIWHPLEIVLEVHGRSNSMPVYRVPPYRVICDTGHPWGIP